MPNYLGYKTFDGNADPQTKAGAYRGRSPRRHSRIRKVGYGACLCLVMLQAPATADEWEQRGWKQSGPKVQAARNMEPLPAGMGAVFVPAMTDPDVEPNFSVLRDGQLLGSSKSGTRFILAPGEATVLVGSRHDEHARPRPVEIRAGEVTILQPDWSGLVVHVLNENGFPFRGNYEIVSLPDRQHVGMGSGAQIELGQRLETWILEPGVYLLLRRGESYRARANFFTVLLRPGHLERIALVMSEEDGSFKGAGDLVAVMGEGTEVEEDLTINWVIGAGLGLDFRRSVPGSVDVTEFVPSVFTDFSLTYSPKPHLLYLRLKLDEEFTQEDWGVYEEEVDILRFDALYSYLLSSNLGPYFRVGLETNLFANYLRLDEEVDFVEKDSPGASLGRADDLRIGKPLFPLVLKGGAGFRTSASWSSFIDFWALAGVGGRQVYNRGVWAGTDDPETEAYEVQRQPNQGDLGAEATLFLELAPLRWILTTAEFEIFVPFTNAKEPSFRLDLDVDLRLTSVVSVVYTLRLVQQPTISPELQQIHSVALRFSVAIF